MMSGTDGIHARTIPQKNRFVLVSFVHSGERVSQCREKIKQRLRSVLLPQDADIPSPFM